MQNKVELHFLTKFVSDFTVFDNGFIEILFGLQVTLKLNYKKKQQENFGIMFFLFSHINRTVKQVEKPFL